MDVFLGWLLRASAFNLTRETLWERWAAQVAANQRAAPALVEEMQGIARGAGVPFESIFLLNSLLDLNSFRYPEMVENFGCSTFAVAAEAGTGKTLLGQTYDMPEFHQNYLAVLRLKPAQGPRQMVFTFAGIVGCAGMNETGIALNINTSARSTPMSAASTASSSARCWAQHRWPTPSRIQPYRLARRGPTSSEIATATS